MIGNAQEEQLPSAQNGDVEGIRRMVWEVIDSEVY